MFYLLRLSPSSEMRSLDVPSSMDSRSTNSRSRVSPFILHPTHTFPSRLVLRCPYPITPPMLDFDANISSNRWAQDRAFVLIIYTSSPGSETTISNLEIARRIVGLHSTPSTRPAHPSNKSHRRPTIPHTPKSPHPPLPGSATRGG